MEIEVQSGDVLPIPRGSEQTLELLVDSLGSNSTFTAFQLSYSVFKYMDQNHTARKW